MIAGGTNIDSAIVHSEAGARQISIDLRIINTNVIDFSGIFITFVTIERCCAIPEIDREVLRLDKKLIS